MRTKWCWVCLAVLLLSAGPVAAAESGAKACCPNCGSAKKVGNDTAGVCPECGQATLFGARLPLAGLLAGAAILAAVLLLVWASRRMRALRGGRRAEPTLATPLLRATLVALVALLVCAGTLLAESSRA